MKRLWVIASATAVSWGVTTLAQPAVSPLQLKVTKNEHVNYKMKTTESLVNDSETVKPQETNETISYTIDAMNMSGQPLSHVQFRWAVLINLPGKPLRAEAGTKSHDLKPAEKFSFDAGPIELRNRTAKVDGYYVEALVDGQVVASDIQPADTKQRIEALPRKRVSHHD